MPGRRGRTIMRVFDPFSCAGKWGLPHFCWFRGPAFVGPREAGGARERRRKERGSGMKNEFIVAITQLAAERNLPREVVLGAVEAALISAFKKDHLAEKDLAVRISPTTGEVHVFAKQTVVVEEEYEDGETQLTLEQARKLNGEIEIGGVIEEEVTPANAGRIAAQTAKQVVLQRLREAEREIVFEEYAGKEGEIVSGVGQRFDNRHVILDLGRAEAVLPMSEQVGIERYRPGMRIKVVILEVGKTVKGPQIVVSRTHKDLLRRLFELEVPEIFNGIVEIKGIAREAGFRSKVAVEATQERVDPVGSCVGLRGIRIQNIVNELHGEKIDVLEWSNDVGTLIGRALAPAQVMNVIADEEKNTAIVVVPDRHLSLAIGREGHNARLAARLSGWRIDIKSTTEAEAQRLEMVPGPGVAVVRKEKPPAEIAERAAAAKAAPAVEADAEVAASAEPATEPAVAADAAADAAEAEPAAEPVAEAVAAEAPAAPVVPAEPAEKAPTLAEALASDSTWKVAPAPQRSAIRFAEDVLDRPERGGGRRQGGGGKKSKKGPQGGGRFEQSGGRG